MKSLILILCLSLPSVVFTQTTDTFWLSGTTDIEDYGIRDDNPTVNYGTATSILLGNGYSAVRSFCISAPYLADSVNAFSAGWEIKEARLEMYEDGTYLAPVTAKSYYIVKPDLEDEATYNRWSSHFAAYFEWTVAGVNDTGSTYNEGDGTGDDRGGTEQGRVVIDAASQWHYLLLDTAWINASIALDSVCSWVVQDSAYGLAAFYSSEYTTDTTKTLRIRVIMEGSAGGATGLANYRHGPDGNEQRHGPDGAGARH